MLLKDANSPQLRWTDPRRDDTLITADLWIPIPLPWTAAFLNNGRKAYIRPKKEEKKSL